MLHVKQLKRSDMKKKTIKGSQILSKLQGVYVIIEDRGYGIEYEIMRGTLKECFAWIREFAPIRVSRNKKKQTI